MSSFYDVIILGRELAGLAAAALLARRGFRVLVLEEGGESYAAGAFTMPLAPFPLLGVESPAFRRILADLNLAQALRRRLTPARPSYQVVLSDARFDVGDAAETARELGRELPEAPPAIEAFSRRAAEVSAVIEPVLGQDITLPPDGFWERRELGRLVSQLPDDRVDLLAEAGLAAGSAARAAWTAPVSFATDLDGIGAVATARLTELWRAGTWRLPGGREALRHLFLDRILNYAGEVRANLTPSEIVLKRGRVAGVRVIERGETFGANFVIGALPVARLPALIAEKLPKRMSEALTAVRPARLRYTLNLVVSLTGVPEAIAGTVFAVADPAQPLAGANFLVIEVGEPEAEGRCTVTVQAQAPAEFAERPHLLAELRTAVRARLDEVMPFLDDHIVCVDSPHDDAPADGPLAPQALRPPLPMDAIWTTAGARALGVCALAHDTGIKHLLLAGRQNLPGLGFEGEMAAAWGCARLVWTSEKKRDLLRREMLLGGS